MNYVDSLPLQRAIVALLLLLTTNVAAQNNALLGGTEYVLAFPDTSRNTFDPRYPNNRFEDRCYIAVYSATDNIVIVTIAGTGYSRVDTIDAGRFAVIDLSSGTSAPSKQVTAVCRATTSGVFRLSARNPVIVYQYMINRFGTEAWAPLPVEAWGGEYYVAAHPGEVGKDVLSGDLDSIRQRNRMMSASIVIVAAYDDTRITVVPNGQIWTLGCPTTNVLLRAGEAYMLQSYVDTLTANTGTPQPDFGGSNVYSTKPVGVLSGNTRALVSDTLPGITRNSYRNMLMEWIRPVDQHGTEFVYVPTQDGLQELGIPGQVEPDKRHWERLRVYATAPLGATARLFINGVESAVRQVLQGEVAEFDVPTHTGAIVRTSRAAQVMLTTPAVAKRGTPDNPRSVLYTSNGSSMCEIVPRDQWSSEVPLHVPAYPPGLAHYAVLIVDTAHARSVRLDDAPVTFTSPVPGTPYTFVTVPLRADEDHLVQGRDGAVVGGRVFSVYTPTGLEQLTPGTPVAAYEEVLAIAYAAPFASRCVVPGVQPDSILFSVTSGCRWMRIESRSMNLEPVGLRRIRLDSAVNATIDVDRNPLTGSTIARVEVTPVDVREPARGVVEFIDRTGAVHRFPYEYVPERLEFDPATLVDFGIVPRGTSPTRQVTITNPMLRDMTLREIRLAIGTVGLQLMVPPTLPLRLERDSGTVSVVIEVRLLSAQGVIRDTLVVRTDCEEFRLPIRMETDDPCVQIDDLDFGVLAPGESKTMPIRVCNDGGGVVTFNNPSGGPLVESSDARFRISPEDVDSLSRTTLRRGECFVIHGTFSSNDTGHYRAVVRVWSSTRRCRDTSFWTARVNRVSTASDASMPGAISLAAPHPNPFAGTTVLGFSVPSTAHARLALTDALGREVAVPWDGPVDPGPRSVLFAAGNLPAGLYTVTLTVGRHRLSRTMLLLR